MEFHVILVVWYPNYLWKHFWKGHTFWTDGYFACSVGNVSEKNVAGIQREPGIEGGDSHVKSI